VLVLIGGLVTLAFIGLFDASEHDIAKTRTRVILFKKVMHILFAEGGIFHSRDTCQSIMPMRLPAIGGYFGMVGVSPMFVTEDIQNTLKNKVVFNCGGEQVLFGGPPAKKDVEEVVDRLKVVTASVLRRAHGNSYRAPEARTQHLPF
jgi:hypothetical protein